MSYENYFIHLKQYKEDQNGNVLFNEEPPRRYVNYFSGEGSDDLMIDEIQQKSQIEISNKTYVKATYLDQLKSRKSLKNSFILKEILDKPISLRND